MVYDSPNLDSIRIHALGGFHSIGASAALITIDGVNILFDCGINAGRIDDPFPQALKNIPIDAILLSHAHVDHIGALPIVLKTHSGLKVFSTYPTKLFAKIMLRDAATHIPRDRPDHFTQSDAEKAAESIEALNFEEDLTFRNLKIRFRQAGHILGASTIIVQAGRKVVYTGDFSIHSTRLTPGPTLPESITSCDVLLSETTYGLNESKPRQEQELIREIGKILESGGRVLIPSFALGRAQEVSVLLVESMINGKIPKCPVYLDGLVKQMFELYAGLGNWVADPSVQSIFRNYEILKPVLTDEKRLGILFGNEPCVIVSSSGMLKGGWSPIYAKDFTSRANSAIFFVGYLDEDSPGRALKDLASGSVKIDDDNMAVRCLVKAFNLSAHADHAGIMKLDSIYRPKVFIPVHGNQNARYSIATDMEKSTGAVVFLPYNGQKFDIDPDYGKITALRGEEDLLSVKFLDKLDYIHYSFDNIHFQNELMSFMRENDIVSNSLVERFLWEIFKNCANYLSGDPWNAISQRIEYLKACNSILRERLGCEKNILLDGFEKTAASYFSNIVLYGVNPAYKDLVKELDIISLEHAQALLIQIWNSLGLRRPTLLELYYKCRVRIDWPAGNELEEKFQKIFAQVERCIEILESFGMIDFLIVSNTLVGAVDKEVILIMLIPSPFLENVGHDSIAEIKNSRLIKLAGWVVPDSVSPVLLPAQTVNNKIRLKLTDQLREILARSVEPFSDKLGGIAASFTDVPAALRREGFDPTISTRFLTAVHKSSNKKLLIVPDENGERFADYRAVPGCLLEIEEFKKSISRVNKVWSPKDRTDQKRMSNGLAVDVITAYGWHAYEPEEIRRKALEDSLDAYDFNYLLRLLRFLRDYTFHDIPEYARVASVDFQWLQNSFGTKHNEETLAFEREVLTYCGLSFTKHQFNRIVVLKT